MKRTIKLLALAAALAVFAVPVLAQQCTDESKAALYQKFLDNRKGEAPQQKIAADSAREYLKCSSDLTEQIPAYLKKWLDQYDAAMGALDTKKQFEAAFKDKKYTEQLRLGRQIVASDPENPVNTPVYIIMGIAGSGDASLLSESAQYAKKAIELIEGGKPFAPYESKDKALAALNYVIARATAKTSQADAITYYLKAVKYDSDLKKNWQIYAELADAYDKGPVAKLTQDYKSKIGPNNTETPESKLALENLYQMIDRQIDALARAAALAGATNKNAIMEDLTALYKYRNKSDTGLTELVANVLSKPIPDVPTPLTSLPTQPTSTPATNGGTNGGSTNGTNGGAKPAGNSTTTGGTNAGGSKTGSASVTGTQTGTRPAATPTPTRRPRSNHRRG